MFGGSVESWVAGAGILSPSPLSQHTSHRPVKMQNRFRDFAVSNDSRHSLKILEMRSFVSLFAFLAFFLPFNFFVFNYPLPVMRALVVNSITLFSMTSLEFCHNNGRTVFGSISCSSGQNVAHTTKAHFERQPSGTVAGTIPFRCTTESVITNRKGYCSP